MIILSFLEHAALHALFGLIIWYVLCLVAHWRVFTKAGEAGWKALIPVYNEYVQYRICWSTKVFWLSLLLAVAASAILNTSESSFAVVGMACNIVYGLIVLITKIKLARSFGHGVLFGLGLLAATPIFTILLGLDSSRYQGPQ